MAVQSEKSSGELIPETVAIGSTRKRYQRRTLLQWSLAVVCGLVGFLQNVQPLSPPVRAALLGLLFPGAGYIACANVTGGILFLVSTALMPLALLAWFGAGGLFFPLFLWTVDIAGAYFAAGTSVWEYAWVVAAFGYVSFVVYWNRWSAKERAAGEKKRAARNRAIPDVLDDIEQRCVPRPEDSERELTLDQLRNVQYVIDVALQEMDDWSNFGIIDQFQTAALRYQLYEIVYSLGVYQGLYAPNFHGYLSAASRNAIEKSLTKRVMNFWKWETLWGKFSTNYDPVIRDNIMVTGFLLQAIMFYTANTGDLRYTEKNSLHFQITDSQVFKYDLHSMDQSLVRQWKASPYCLFPCEPNWIYTPCNFQGMAGQVLYDRVFGTEHSKTVMPRFSRYLDEDFTEPSGSILPIRSELTGFTIPGLCGALSDLFVALVTRGYLDHVSRRMYAIFVSECVRFDPNTGEISLQGLVGADKMDPGLYKASDIAIYPILAAVAGEFGDEKVRQAVLRKLDASVEYETMKTGAKRFPRENAGFSMNTLIVRGKLLKHDDWRTLITKGPSQTTLAGPILSEVPYPGVLVAKARSNTSHDLDLVLYPSAESGDFTMSVEKLNPNQDYNVGGEQQKADDKGCLRFTARVDGRTEINIRPAGPAKRKSPE